MLAQILFISFLVKSSWSLYTSKDDVLLLNPTSWKKEVLESKHVVLAEFFAPWCGHCKSLAPTYKTVASKTKGVVKVVAVDCDSYQQLCGQYGIQGFPTIKLFGSDKKISPTDYTGPRDAAGLVNFAVSKVASFVKPIGSAKDAVSLEDFYNDPETKNLPKAVLFAKKFVTPALLKGLSVEYENRLVIGEVGPKSKDLGKKYGITSFPTLVVFPVDGDFENPIIYKDSLKYAEITAFLNQYALPATKEKPRKKVVFDPNVNEVKNQKDLEKNCLEKPVTCIISFLALEPESQESKTQFEEHHKLLKSIKKAQFDQDRPFDFMWINPITYSKAIKEFLKTYDVSDMYPGLIAINHSRGWYRNFRSAFDADGINGFLTEIVKGKGRNFKIPDGKVVIKEKKEETNHQEL